MTAVDVAPRVLIASYPRTGSTAMERILDLVLPGSGGLVHEPYNRHGGPGALDFWETVDTLAVETRVLKHHPGSLLSDRQNTYLYRSWLAAEGTIVHLTRGDLRAQAKSLLIARNLNSYHRGHRVGRVDPADLATELADLTAEVEHQSALLAGFPTIEVGYETVFGGPLEKRLNAVRELVSSVHPDLATRMGQLTEQVAEIVGPGGRVRPSPETDTVELISQIPTMRGLVGLLAPEECAAWVEAARAGPAARLDPTTGLSVQGAVDVMGDTAVEHLLDSLEREMRESRGIRLRPREAAPPVLVIYDGDRYPDHDLGLHHPLPARRDIAVDFAVSLSPDGTWEGGGVHLSGLGSDPESLTSGIAHYFSSALGARRNPVTSGRLVSLVGRIPLEPGQILAPGQVIGDGDHWR